MEQYPTCLKAALYGLTADLPLLSLLKVIRRIVPGVQTPRWDLDPAALTLGKGIWVFL